MDLESIISAIKKEGTIVKMPIRLRRKAKERVSTKGMGVDRAKKALRLRRATKRYEGTIDGNWCHMRNAYRNRNKRRLARGGKLVEWNLSLNEWRRIWKLAGIVSLPGGKTISAFQLRGSGPSDCKIYRIDENKPWEMVNVFVSYNGRCLVDGRKINV